MDLPDRSVEPLIPNERPRGTNLAVSGSHLRIPLTRIEHMRGTICFTLILMTLGCTAQAPARFELGFSLNGTTFIYKVFEDSVVTSEAISHKSFIMQGMGVEASRANPADSNLFERFAIRDCGGAMDTTTKAITYYCFPLDDVQKLMTGAASDGSGNFGWAAHGYQPGDGQQRILAKYRTAAEEHWLGPYVGEGAFNLMHDLQDPGWVARYKAAQ